MLLHPMVSRVISSGKEIPKDLAPVLEYFGPKVNKSLLLTEHWPVFWRLKAPEPDSSLSCSMDQPSSQVYAAHSSWNLRQHYLWASCHKAFSGNVFEFLLVSPHKCNYLMVIQRTETIFSLLDYTLLSLAFLSILLLLESYIQALWYEACVSL